MNPSFHLDHIGWSNLVLPDFDPISFSVFGMSIVFAGLVVISLYILFLPKLLSLASHLKHLMVARSNTTEKSQLSSEGGEESDEREILTAIAVALHLDQDFPEENQRITWLSHGDDDSAWLASGLSHGVSRRHSLHITRRKF